MITLAKFSADFILDKVTDPPVKIEGSPSQKKNKLPFNVGDESFNINVSSVRLRTFKANRKCSCCGLEGTKMYLQRPEKADEKHFNLFGEKGGELILMTKDHITPISKGGTNTLDNFQTMCSQCNCLKGNRVISNEELLKEKNERLNS